jgi:hypothetical protein
MLIVTGRDLFPEVPLLAVARKKKMLSLAVIAVGSVIENVCAATSDEAEIGGDAHTAPPAAETVNRVDAGLQAVGIAEPVPLGGGLRVSPQRDRSVRCGIVRR